MRLQDNLYPMHARRVTNPELLATYRAHVEQSAQKWLNTQLLTSVQIRPDDIWFFALSPRQLPVVQMPSVLLPLR